MKNLTLKNVDQLPARTWNGLGVNGENIELPAGRIAPYTGSPFQNTGIADVEVTPVASGAAAFLDKDVETGMGNETRDFIKKNRNTGFLIEAAEGKKISEPVVLDYRIDGDNPAVLDDSTIVAQPGSKITVVMDYQSAAAGLHAGLTRVYVRAGAVVNLVQTQILGADCLHLNDIGAVVMNGGTFNLIQAQLGGSHTYAGCKARLEDGGKLNIGTIYLGNGDRTIDINYTAEHTGVKSDSKISVRGALLDRSSKIFRGTIDFKKGARGAKGREEEFNVLLSSQVRNRTSPLILCAEEDVDGQHAASTGRVSEDKLFYLMSRGLSMKEAKRLIIEATFAPVMEKIPLPELRKEISGYVERRIGGLE